MSSQSRTATPKIAADGLTTARAIPTGVDLDFFAWQAPADGSPVVVFTGSMDWEANVDGIRFYIEEVWPLVRAKVPDAQLRVVGKTRHPRWYSAMCRA